MEQILKRILQRPHQLSVNVKGSGFFKTESPWNYNSALLYLCSLDDRIMTQTVAPRLKKWVDKIRCMNTKLFRGYSWDTRRNLFMYKLPLLVRIWKCCMALEWIRHQILTKCFTVNTFSAVFQDYLAHIIDMSDLPIRPEQVCALFGNIEDIYEFNRWVTSTNTSTLRKKERNILDRYLK